MSNSQKFYINGAWVKPETGSTTFDLIHPANEEKVDTIAMGTKADVDHAVAAAKAAFEIPESLRGKDGIQDLRPIPC